MLKWKPSALHIIMYATKKLHWSALITAPISLDNCLINVLLLIE